jgi:acetoacetate decarboxylase
MCGLSVLRFARDDAGVVVRYPPPPWRLAGRLLIALAPVRVDAARALVPAPLRLLPVWPGRALAMLLAGLYGEASTLRYGELAGVAAPVLAGGRLGGLVTSIWVDDERALAGGRHVWGLPKQLATLQWRPGEVEVRDPAGAPIVHARWREPRVHARVPAAAPFIAVFDGAVRHAWLVGSLHVAPTAIELDIPAGSPLAPFGLTGRRLGLTGRVNVRATAPRDAAPDPRGARGRPGRRRPSPLRRRLPATRSSDLSLRGAIGDVATVSRGLPGRAG